jgi:hypothetical protein
MAERRNSVLYTDTLKKIDENRGDLSQADFIDSLIDKHLKESHDLGDKKSRETSQTFATKEELANFENDVKRLMKEFLSFFVTYSIELGKPSANHDIEEMTKTLHNLDKE